MLPLTSIGEHYVVDRVIGRGGMATVYLAADLKHDRKVAIKVLKPELAAVLAHEIGHGDAAADYVAALYEHESRRTGRRPSQQIRGQHGAAEASADDCYRA